MKEHYLAVIESLAVKKAELNACKGNDRNSPIYRMIESEIIDLNICLGYLRSEIKTM